MLNKRNSEILLDFTKFDFIQMGMQAKDLFVAVGNPL